MASASTQQAVDRVLSEIEDNHEEEELLSNAELDRRIAELERQEKIQKLRVLQARMDAPVLAQDPLPQDPAEGLLRAAPAMPERTNSFGYTDKDVKSLLAYRGAPTFKGKSVHEQGTWVRSMNRIFEIHRMGPTSTDVKEEDDRRRTLWAVNLLRGDPRTKWDQQDNASQVETTWDFLQ